MHDPLPRLSTDALLRADGVSVSPDEVARIWREVALGWWQVLAAADEAGTRYAAIAPLRKTVIHWKMLQPRERQVLGIAAHGASQKVIASELGLTASRVSNALYTARARLGFGSVADLLRAYEASDPLARKQ